jgi:ribosomal protein S18 acetylase RimI-like enzyme
MRRLAVPDDLKKVHAIAMDPGVAAFLTYEPMSVAAFNPIFHRLLADRDFYVFERDGHVVGIYKVTRGAGRAAHVAQLGWVATAPTEQGKGIGKAMLLDALDHLEHEGVSRVDLLAEADNERGLRFYRGLGFEIEGVQRSAYRRQDEDRYVDEHLMVRFLGELATT